MCPDLGILGFDPNRLARNDGLLLLVNYIVMQNTGQSQLVSSGPVGMQDHLAILEEFVRKRLPVWLADGTRTWRSGCSGSG